MIGYFRMNKNLISILLNDFHELDQADRHTLVSQHGTARVRDAKDPVPFYVFKGVTEERIRIVMFLVEQNALSATDDYFFAAAILANAGKLDYLILAYKLIKQYRKKGGERLWGFFDTFYERQQWGKTREEVEYEIQKIIGVHPNTLDKFLKKGLKLQS